MQLRYNYRVYPDAAQCRALASAFGCARVVWNDCLRDRREAHAAGLPYVKSAELSRLSQHPGQAHRGACLARRCVSRRPATVPPGPGHRLQELLRQPQGRAAGPQGRPSPLQVEEDTRQSIRLNTNAFRLQSDGAVYVAKVGNLKVKWSRRLPAAPTSLTVTKDSCGRYFLSFVVDTEPDILSELEADAGIDLGLSAFAVLSDGRKIDSPRFLRRAEKKLKRLQRELSRKAKGSKNRAKARIKVARQHARVADRRRDFHHKASTQIIRDNQAVYVEDLAVSGLGRTRLAKSVHDAGWSAFVGMLRLCTAAPSPRWTVLSRPRRSARPADSGTAPSPCTSGSGHAARAAPCTTATTTQPATSCSKDAVSSPPDGRRR